MDVHFFDSIEECIEIVTRRKYYSYKIYAHNGGKFDFLAFFEQLNKNFPIQILQSHGRLIQIKIEVAERRYVYFRDSFSLFPVSLKKLTEAFKVAHAKLELDFEKEKFDKNNPRHVEYLTSDVIGLYECLTTFFASPKIEDTKPRLTEGSTALSVFRTMMPRSVKTPSQAIQNFSRKSYYGGRVEIFRHEGYDIDLYDVNSMFPYMMKTKPLPIEYLGRSHDHHEFGFHDVTVFVPEMYIPPLPYRREKLFFPTGVFRGVFFSEELKQAELMGVKIVKYHHGERFAQTYGFFDEYVEFFYKMRTDNEANALNYIGKRMLNCLYGKFGQKEESQTLVQLGSDDDDGTLEVFGSEAVFEKFQLGIKKTKRRAPHMMVNIPSAITGYSRVHQLTKILLPNADTIRYTDTDCGFMKNKFIQSSKLLGDLKHEDSYKYGYFALPKGYAVITQDDKTKVKLKGFSSRFLKTLHIEKFKNLDISSSEKKVLGLKSALKRFNTPFIATDVKRSIKSGYDKRVTLPNLDTRPWQLTKEGIFI